MKNMSFIFEKRFYTWHFKWYSKYWTGGTCLILTMFQIDACSILKSNNVIHPRHLHSKWLSCCDICLCLAGQFSNLVTHSGPIMDTPHWAGLGAKSWDLLHVFTRILNYIDLQNLHTKCWMQCPNKCIPHDLANRIFTLNSDSWHDLWPVCFFFTLLTNIVQTFKFSPNSSSAWARCGIY